MQAGKLRRPSICHGGPRQEDKGSMNVHILSNTHARQKQNKKKTFDQVKTKVKLKRDELQAQAQQMS
jgi:hypothetical protein